MSKKVVTDENYYIRTQLAHRYFNVYMQVDLMYSVPWYYLGNTVIISAVPSIIIIVGDNRQLQTSPVIV